MLIPRTIKELSLPTIMTHRCLFPSRMVLPSLNNPCRSVFLFPSALLSMTSDLCAIKVCPHRHQRRSLHQPSKPAIPSFSSSSSSSLSSSSMYSLYVTSRFSRFPLFRSTFSSMPSLSPTSSFKKHRWWLGWLLGVVLLGWGGILYLQDPTNKLTPLVTKGLLLLDPETAHEWAIRLLQFPWFVPHAPPELVHHPRLKNALGWPNPIGLAAGFDKHGEAVQGLSVIGFGAIEVGSVTPLPQPGNPRPRVFRVPESLAVINRYGFNSKGHAYTHARLWSRPTSTVPMPLVGVNLGRNKEGTFADYVEGLRRLHDVADYLVINVSSPNTPGLRDVFKAEGQLATLLTMCVEENQRHGHTPLFLKICIDHLSHSELHDIAVLVQRCGVQGIILGNTTVQRPETLRGATSTLQEPGGLSGAPLKPLHLPAVRYLASQLPSTVRLIGCGGIMDAEDVIAYAKAGAHAVQMYTGLIYHGPGRVARILNDVVGYLEHHGIGWEELVGQDLRAGVET